MLLKKLKVLCLVFLLSISYFQILKVNAVEADLFTCDTNSQQIMADGLVLKLKDFSNKAKIEKVLLSVNKLKQELRVSPLENDQDLEAEYLSLNKDTKRQKKLAKYKQIKHQLGLDRTYLLKDSFHKSHKYSCVELYDIQDQILEIIDRSSIEYLEPNYIRNLLSPISFDHELSSSLNSSPWALDKMQVKAAWNHSTGEGVKVAMLDSGIEYNHPNLWKKVWIDSEVVNDMNSDGLISLDDVDTNANQIIDNDVFNSEISTLNNESIFGEYYNNAANGNPLDGFGHGTHVAGIIAAEDINDSDYNGIE